MLLHPAVRSGWILSVSVLDFDLTGKDSWEPLLAFAFLSGFLSIFFGFSGVLSPFHSSKIE